jgi:hypothetical protein
MSEGERYRVVGVDRYRATSGETGEAEYRIAEFDHRDEAFAFARQRAAQPQPASPELCDLVVLRDVLEGAVLFSAQRPPA